MKIVRVYEIAGHGKGEDHVGGMSKVGLRGEVAAGQSFIHTDDMVEFLEQKFPNHFFDVISTKELEDRQSEDALLSVKTIDGSSKFQVVKNFLTVSKLKLLQDCVFATTVW